MPFVPAEQNLTSSSAFLFSLQNPEFAAPFKLEINTSEPTNHLQAAQSSCTGPSIRQSRCFHKRQSQRRPYLFSKLGQVYQLPQGVNPSTSAAENLLAGSAYFIPDDVEVFVHKGDCNTDEV